MPVNINASNSAGIQITADTSGVIQFQSNGANTVQIAANGTIFPIAGTTSVAPIDLTAGTNMTTPIAGAIEYDGKVPYITPQGTQRGVIPGMQYFRLNADLAGANVNTAQNIFGVGCTLSASTVYAFEAVYGFIKSAGTTAHTLSIGFGGTATLNNIIYVQTGSDSTSSFLNRLNATTNFLFIQTANSTAITGAMTGAAEYVMSKIIGTVSVNAGGTFIPQYTLSAAPGGAYSTVAGSYINIYPIGASGANVSVGTWA